MADSVEITLWIDRRWKNAIERHLKGETLQEHLETVLDELCNQLPEQEYERISSEIQNEARTAREEQEAARIWSAYHVIENGEERYFKMTPGEELPDAAKKLCGCLKEDAVDEKFIRLFSSSTHITPEEYQDMMCLRMENTGNVTGVFDIDFDKREFSAVNAFPRNSGRSSAQRVRPEKEEQRNERALVKDRSEGYAACDDADGREITTAGHISAQNFVFSDEIIEQDGKLNFYIETWFDVDKVFGTRVLTDQNDDWLNVYANYDIERGEVCDTLELTLCKDSGADEHFTYPLNAAEKEVLLRRMDEFCRQQTGMNLTEYAQQLREEQMQGPELGM